MALYEQPFYFINTQTVVLLFLVLLAFTLLRFNKKSNQLPPGPRGWPLFGSVPHIEKESYLSFERWGKKYGDVFMVHLGWGRSDAVILNSLDAVKCTLKDQGDKFANRNTLPIIKFSIKVKGSISFENGHDWNERRRWIFGVLRNLCLDKNRLESSINLEADYLCQEIDRQSDPFNPLHCVNNAVSNIICTATFGNRFEYSDTQFKELMEGIRYIFKHITMSSPVNVLPFLYFTPMYKHFRNFTYSLKKFVDDIILQHQETFNSNDIRDVIDSYIMESQKENVDSNVFGMDILWRTIIDLFFGGTDTTTCTIMWIIVYLVNYPEIQKRVQQEIDDVLGQEKKPTWGDRHSMPFLEATIMEIQRLSNVGPLVGRSTSEEVQIKGYKIPAGTSVITNLWSIHHDSDHWERPFNFEPERFLSDDLNKIKRHESFMPFGVGRRVCVGDLMARMELFLFTANFMQRFTFMVAEGEPIPSINECVPGLTRYPKPYTINVIKR